MRLLVTWLLICTLGLFACRSGTPLYPLKSTAQFVICYNDAEVSDLPSFYVGGLDQLTVHVWFSEADSLNAEVQLKTPKGTIQDGVSDDSGQKSTSIVKPFSEIGDACGKNTINKGMFATFIVYAPKEPELYVLKANVGDEEVASQRIQAVWPLVQPELVPKTTTLFNADGIHGAKLEVTLPVGTVPTSCTLTTDLGYWKNGTKDAQSQTKKTQIRGETNTATFTLVSNKPGIANVVAMIGDVYSKPITVEFKRLLEMNILEKGKPTTELKVSTKYDVEVLWRSEKKDKKTFTLKTDFGVLGAEDITCTFLQKSEICSAKTTLTPLQTGTGSLKLIEKQGIQLVKEYTVSPQSTTPTNPSIAISLTPSTADADGYSVAEVTVTHSSAEAGKIISLYSSLGTSINGDPVIVGAGNAFKLLTNTNGTAVFKLRSLNPGESHLIVYSENLREETTLTFSSVSNFLALSTGTTALNTMVPVTITVKPNTTPTTYPPYKVYIEVKDEVKDILEKVHTHGLFKDENGATFVLTDTKTGKATFHISSSIQTTAYVSAYLGGYRDSVQVSF